MEEYVASFKEMWVVFICFCFCFVFYIKLVVYTQQKFFYIYFLNSFFSLFQFLSVEVTMQYSWFSKKAILFYKCSDRDYTLLKSVWLEPLCHLSLMYFLPWHEKSTFMATWKLVNHSAQFRRLLISIMNINK